MDEVSYRSSALMTHARYVEFVQNGVVVAVLPATFDFSNVPPELHSLGLAMVAGGFRVGLPGPLKPPAAKPQAPTAKPWWKLW